MSVLLYPPYLQWEVCSECNHKCIHCYNYWRAENSPMEQCDDLEKIADKIIERKPLYLAITGGEPLLMFERLKPCVKKFREAGITVSFSTNGTLITEEIAKYFSENKIDLVISLPSIDEEICDKVCTSKNVVKKLSKVWPLLQKYHVGVNVNIVVTKLNISTLYQTLEAVHKLGFVARVGLAQAPINASDEYKKYELDRNDLNYIVSECLRAKRNFDMELDFSVCLPDCAFDNQDDLKLLQKGDCFAGTIAYAITTNGDIKACQCDTRVYGNILKDSFVEAYKKMGQWRDGSLIPAACRNCSKVSTCRGGCRVESYANSGDYKSLPTFANIDNAACKSSQTYEITDYSNVEKFHVNKDAIFLRDLECYRVSVGIIMTHLSIEFAEWLKDHIEFNFEELLFATGATKNNLNVILDMLIKNTIILID